jgi:hypothetical protein
MACVSKTDYKRRLRESPPEIFHTQHLQKTQYSVELGLLALSGQQKARKV